MSEYHLPVMLPECIEALNLKPGGVYVDLTFGGGGHAKEILANPKPAVVFGFDRDEDAVKNADQISDPRFIFAATDFRHFSRYLKMHGHPKVDGILADLGISSHQIDDGPRGFSIREDADLDMRMDQGQLLSAKDFLNTRSETELRDVFREYGEIKNAFKLAQRIVASRIAQPFDTTGRLKEVAMQCAPKNREFKYAAQVFQAVRIAVNDEIGALEKMLIEIPEVLKPGGRLVVMSYHSLEDRRVKNFIRSGNFTGKEEKDFYGNLIRPLEPVGKMVKASEDEIARNPRSRSACLRIAEKPALGKSILYINK